MEREEEDSPQPPDERSSGNNKDEEDDKESGFVEVDPTGRYGRYDEILGKGAFKTVYRAFDEFDGMEVAWNQVRVQDLLQCPQDLDRLYAEVNLLKTLKHKNIIKFYNSWIDTKTQNVNFITEIFTSGTLRQYRKKHKHCDLKAVKNWSRQILRGLLYLHSHDPPIIHRDLKCDNIFVNGNQGEVKIGDLGLAAILKQAHAAHSVIGTPEFMAPELYEENYNELVDIYSFGMCVLEMVTFEYPYSECTNAAQIYRKVTSGKKPAALDKVKDPDVRSFVEKCLASASMRLPARELLMDPFLNDGDSIDLLNSIPRTESKPEEIAGLATIAEEPLSHRSDSFPDSFLDLDRDQASALSRGTPDDNLLANTRKFPSLTDSEGEIESSSIENESLMNETSETRRSGRDFNVKGKKRDEDGTIFLRLRIADSSGHTRNIHFPFDIHVDTAFSVASEMVTELDLSDQDVTNIAEMIDREILELYPDWKVGVSIDENISTTEMESETNEATGNFAGLAPDADTPDVPIEGGETMSAAIPDGEESEAADNQDSLTTVQSTDSIRSNHQRENSFQLQDELFTGSTNRLQGSILSPTTKVIAASLPNMPLERATFHGRFWENPDDAHEVHSSSSDENIGGNLGSIDEGDRDEKDEQLPFTLSDTDLRTDDSESNLTQKKSYAMVVKANAAHAKEKSKPMKKYLGRVMKSKQEFPRSPEIKPSSAKHLVTNIPALEVQKAFQSIMQPIAPRKENHVKLNGSYQHSVVVQVSLNQDVESGDLADDDTEDPDLNALMEKLRLEKEREIRELEEKYKKKLLELQNRPSKQRKSNMPPSRTIGFDVDTVANQEPLSEMNPLIHSVS